MSKLTAQQRQTLISLHRHTKDRRQADRIKTILLLDQGWDYRRIAEALFLDDSTLRDWVKQYDEYGLTELLTDHFTGSKKQLSEAQIEALKAELRTATYVTSSDVCRYAEREFGVSYTPAGLVKLLRRIGFVYKKTKRIPGKADAGKQKAFLKEIYEATKAAMQPGDQLYFTDGVHPQHNVVASYGWIEKSTEKEVRSNTGRTSMAP